MTNKLFGRILREVRIQKNLTIQDVVNETKLSRNTIYLFEKTGIVNPSTLKLLSFIYNVDLLSIQNYSKPQKENFLKEIISNYDIPLE